MSDRRPLASFTSGDYDFPPATSSNNAGDPSSHVTTRLERLRQELQRTREQARSAEEAAATERYARWASSRFRRRRVREPEPANPSPLPDANQPSVFVTGDTSDADEDRQRCAKRRKTHHHEPEARFTYGHYGQVEAGRLRLRLESCDGDIHDDRGRVYYGPENLLKHDKSVYCTRTSTCNIVLRHHDSTPFTLEKLHIIAPEDGFTAPLKQGMVFVAMDRESLLPHIRATAQRFHYLNDPPRSPSNQGRDGVRLSLLESLNDPHVSRALSQSQVRYRSPSESSSSTSEATRYMPSSSSSPEVEALRPSPRRPATEPFELTACDEQSYLASDEDTQIVILTDDEISWPEDPTTPAVLADRQRRQREMADYDDDDMHGIDIRFHGVNRQSRRGHRPGGLRKDTRHLTAGPQSKQSKSDGVTQTHFQIKEGKHKVAIRFEPAVSGTHILLKLQTPYVGKNIDIQTVIASGYAGPRFFAAVQMK